VETIVGQWGLTVSLDRYSTGGGTGELWREIEGVWRRLVSGDERGNQEEKQGRRFGVVRALEGVGGSGRGGCWHVRGNRERLGMTGGAHMLVREREGSCGGVSRVGLLPRAGQRLPRF
jgi:hypothetical protein